MKGKGALARPHVNGGKEKHKYVKGKQKNVFLFLSQIRNREPSAFSDESWNP